MIIASDSRSFLFCWSGTQTQSPVWQNGTVKTQTSCIPASWKIRIDISFFPLVAKWNEHATIRCHSGYSSNQVATMRFTFGAILALSSAAVADVSNRVRKKCWRKCCESVLNLLCFDYASVSLLFSRISMHIICTELLRGKVLASGNSGEWPQWLLEPHLWYKSFHGTIWKSYWKSHPSPHGNQEQCWTNLSYRPRNGRTSSANEQSSWRLAPIGWPKLLWTSSRNWVQQKISRRPRIAVDHPWV